MTRAGERIPLETFLEETADMLSGDLGQGLDDLARVSNRLLAHLNTHPQLAAQVAKLRETLPASLAGAAPPDRITAATEARRIAADIKKRWIEAEAPPLVDEIDDRLSDIDTALARIARPGIETLRESAARIDRLGRIGGRLDGAERHYVPWAILGGIAFLLGFVLFAIPGALGVSPNRWIVVSLLSILPVVGILYAIHVMPRSRADAEIDDLNRVHFVPNGGIYFPESDGPACVVRIEPPPARTEGEIARSERQKTKEKLSPW